MPDVISTRLKRELEQVLFLDVLCLDDENSLVVEQVADATGRTQVAAANVEDSSARRPAVRLRLSVNAVHSTATPPGP